MLEIALNSAAVISLYFAVGWCFRDKTANDIDEASLMPFADDPEVARRVELATGKTVNAVQTAEPEPPKPGWGKLEL